MKKNVKKKPEAAKPAAVKEAVPEKSDLRKKKIKAAEAAGNKSQKGKNTRTAPAEKESKPAVPKSAAAKKPPARKEAVKKKESLKKKEAVKKKETAGKSKKAKTLKPVQKEVKAASVKVKEYVKESVPVAAEEREMKMEVFFYDLTSLQKTRTDPKGTMLIAKFKQHEIGIHADPKLSSLMFSYYPKHGNGEMVNIPISIKDIISFISQKAG